MRKNIIVLIIGQNKNNDFFRSSIDILVSRTDISKVIIVTWQDTDVEYIYEKSKVHLIRVHRHSSFKYDGAPGRSIEYQKYLYDIGMKYICNKYSDDTYILKTRMDVLVDNVQLDYIFSQDYHNPTHVIKYKTWVAWAHITKPYYMEDSCFYSHISVMKKLTPRVDDVLSNLSTGHSHIRWYMMFSEIYDVYSHHEYTKKKNIYQSMTNKFKYSETHKTIIDRYIKCLDECFIVKTVPGGIKFRPWSDPSSHTISNNDINHIIRSPAPQRLKIVYDIDDILSIKT